MHRSQTPTPPQPTTIGGLGRRYAATLLRIPVVLWPALFAGQPDAFRAFVVAPIPGIIRSCRFLPRYPISV
jgi:hypothetical protein